MFVSGEVSREVKNRFKSLITGDVTELTISIFHFPAEWKTSEMVISVENKQQTTPTARVHIKHYCVSS